MDSSRYLPYCASLPHLTCWLLVPTLVSLCPFYPPSVPAIFIFLISELLFISLIPQMLHFSMSCPFFFFLFLSSLGDLIHIQGFSYHSYADKSQGHSSNLELSLDNKCCHLSLLQKPNEHLNLNLYKTQLVIVSSGFILLYWTQAPHYLLPKILQSPS